MKVALAAGPPDPAQRLAVGALPLGVPVHGLVRDVQTAITGEAIQLRACRIPGEVADNSFVIGQDSAFWQQVRAA